MKLGLLTAGVLIAASAPLALPKEKYPQQTTNAALRYWMAFAEMQDPPADKATQDLLEKVSEGKAAWDEAKLGPILEANDEAIRTMQRGTKLPHCEWGIEYDRGPRAALYYVPRARVMARLNHLYGIRAMAKGNSQAAVDAWLAGFRFSEHVASGGPLLLALVAKAALLPNLQVLASETKQGHLGDAQKMQVIAAVKEMREDGFDWGEAWRLEELTLQHFLVELRGATDLRAAYESLMGEAMPSGAKMPSLEETRRFRDYMASVQAVLGLPPEAAKSRLLALETQRRSLSELLQRLIPSAPKVNDARLEIFAARKNLLETLAAK